MYFLWVQVCDCKTFICVGVALVPVTIRHLNTTGAIYCILRTVAVKKSILGYPQCVRTMILRMYDDRQLVPVAI